MDRPPPVSAQRVLVARLLPWLPAQQCLAALARVSRGAAGAVRAAFEVVAAPGEDLRPLLASRVPDFGTLRVPPGGCVLTGAISEPFFRSGLILCGIRPEQGFYDQCEDENWEERFSSAGLTALRSFAGELDAGQTKSLVVPNGLRLCVVRDCEARDVRQHALLLRWDVCVLVERCALHGKVLIEEGPAVEFRRNPHLVLNGEQLDPDFVGTLRGGRLQETPPEARSPVQRRTSGRGRRRRQGSVAAPEVPGREDAARLRRGRSLTAGRATWAPGGGSSK